MFCINNYTLIWSLLELKYSRLWPPSVHFSPLVLELVAGRRRRLATFSSSYREISGEKRTHEGATAGNTRTLSSSPSPHCSFSMAAVSALK